MADLAPPTPPPPPPAVRTQGRRWRRGSSRSPDECNMEEEEVGNKKDHDVGYGRLLAPSSSGNTDVDLDEVIHMVYSTSFVSTQGWDPEMVVDYRINKEEFHKSSLLDYDFFT